MKTLMNIALVAGLALGLSTQVAAFSLGDAVGAANKAMDAKQSVDNTDKTAASKSLTDSVLGGFPVAGDTADLVSNLSEQLGVTPKQAAGGTAALFAQAQSELPQSQFAGLTDKVSGLSSLLGGDSGLAGSLLKTATGGAGGVGSAFSALGMSSDMVGKFIPVISNFLGDQGVAASLVSSLQSVWGAAG